MIDHVAQDIVVRGLICNLEQRGTESASLCNIFLNFA